MSCLSKIKKYFQEGEGGPAIGRVALVIGGALILIAGHLASCARPRLYVNTSASMPRGLYIKLEEEPRGDLVPGQLVLLRAPPRAHRAGCVGQEGAWLIKQVAALPGERVCHQDGVTRTPTARFESHPALIAKMPAVQGCQVIPPAHVYLLTPHPRSCDSRVFGPISEDAIAGRVAPLLTEPERSWRASASGR